MHFRYPSLLLTVLAFVLAGPLLWVFPFLLVGSYWPGLYFPSGPYSIDWFLPAMGGIAWLLAALQPKLWPVTILPTVTAPILLWLVARNLSRCSFGSRLIWAGTIAVAAALISGLTFLFFALLGLLLEQSSAKDGALMGITVWALVVALTGMLIGAVLGLLSRAAPNDSFKPKPLRGSA